MFRYRGVARLSRQIGAHVPPRDWKMAPIVFFNASTRTSGLSLNGAFALLANWALGSPDGGGASGVSRRSQTPVSWGRGLKPLDAPRPARAASPSLDASTQVRRSLDDTLRKGRVPGDMAG